MPKKNPPLTQSPQPDLSLDFEQAFYTATRKQMQFEPPAVLTALINLLVKPKRIASVLRIKPELVRFYITGRQRTPEHYLPPLAHLLRLAIVAAKREVVRAEKREILWGRIAFPAETLEFFRARIKEAEVVLQKEESGQ